MKNRKIISSIIVSSMIISSFGTNLSVLADDVDDGAVISESSDSSEFEGTLANGSIILNFSDTDNNGTYDKLVISGNGQMLQFNDSYNDYNSYVSDIETLIVDDGISFIPASAFQNHTKLKYVEYGNSMNMVNSNQFDGCTNLEEVHLAAVADIQYEAFRGCTSLKSIVIPEGAKIIGGEAFKGCTGLEEVQLPSTLYVIYRGAFSDCTSLSSINLGDTKLQQIESLAFENCISLKNITIPSTFVTTEPNKFAGCNLDTINMYCSTYQPSIDVLVREWGDKVIVSHGDVVSMDDVAATCTSFGYTGGTKCSGCGLVYEQPTRTDRVDHTPITVPAEEPTCTRNGHTEYIKCEVCNTYITNPTRIDAHHVYDDSDDEDCNVCGAIRAFDYVYDDNITYRYIDHDGDTQFDGIIINGVDELTAEIASDIIWNAPFTVEYLEIYGFTSIGEMAFECCELVDVKVGDSVESIGMGAFCSSAYLKHVELPEYLIAIGECAFIDCISLESIVLPNGIDVIYNGTFQDCVSLQSVVIPEGVYEICDYAFAGCDLRTLDLPSTMLYLDDACLDGNENLSSITMYCNDESLVDIMTYIYGDIVTVNHDVQTVEGVPATCTEDGYRDYQMCNLCGMVVGDREVYPQTGHNVVIDLEVPATCEQLGLTAGSHCSECGFVIVPQVEIEALDHDYEVIPKKAATCTEAGNAQGLVCSVCGDVLKEAKPIAPLGHTVVIDPAVETTCNEAGLTEGSHCSRCNEVLVAQETVEALGHSVVVDEALEPTCELNGHTSGSHCTRCNTVLENQVVITALGHNEVIDEGYEPSCTVYGRTDGKHCDRCGKVLEAQAIVESLGHIVITDNAVDATCTEDGLTTGYHCDRCQETFVEQEVIPATGHTEVIDPAEEPTPTREGLTEGIHCGVCGEILVAQEVVPYSGPVYEESLLGHSITLDGSIGINFYIKLSDDAKANPNTSVLFTNEAGITTRMLIEDAVYDSSMDAYVFKYQVVAKQMSDVITAQVFIPGPTDWHGDVYSYSVAQYADELSSMAASDSRYERALNLVMAMLTYGAYSQEYFEYSLDRMPLPENARVNIDNVMPADVYDYGQYGKLQGNIVVFVGGSLSLLSETSLKLYFKLPDNVSWTSVRFEMDNGHALMPIKAGNYYYVEIPNIAACDLDKVYNINVYFNLDYDCTISYSPMTYCYNTLMSNNNGSISATRLQNLVKAIYVYNQAANEYFGR